MEPIEAGTWAAHVQPDGPSVEVLVQRRSRSSEPARAWMGASLERARGALALSPERALAPLEVFAPRGVAARPRLEGIVRSVVDGCHAALRERRPVELAALLDATPAARRGFAYEGAGLGLALVDAFVPVRRARLLEFARGAGARHRYLILIGAGLAAARLPRPFARRALAALDGEPTLRWLAFDGLGFHAGFFDSRRSLAARRVPRRIGGYARRAFDQGLGRSLWFVEARDRRNIPRAIEAFDAERRADLWSGVGLAAAYAGGEPAELVRALLGASGSHRADFAQGVAFAAEARERAANADESIELACALAWNASPEQVAAWVERARGEAESSASQRDELPIYERWRNRVRARHADRAHRGGIRA